MILWGTQTLERPVTKEDPSPKRNESMLNDGFMNWCGILSVSAYVGLGLWVMVYEIFFN